MYILKNILPSIVQHIVCTLANKSHGITVAIHGMVKYPIKRNFKGTHFSVIPIHVWYSTQSIYQDAYPMVIKEHKNIVCSALN